MWLITIVAFVALALTSAFTFTIPFTLCADVVAEHSSEYKIFLWREFVQWTGDDEPDSFQTLAPTEIHVQVLLSGRLQQVWNILTFQSPDSLLTVFLVTGEQYHVANALMQFVDVVHQHLKCCGICCSHFYGFDFVCKIREKKRSVQYLKCGVLNIAHMQSRAKAD
jgi:hypothetical protein